MNHKNHYKNHETITTDKLSSMKSHPLHKHFCCNFLLRTAGACLTATAEFPLPLITTGKQITSERSQTDSCLELSQGSSFPFCWQRDMDSAFELSAYQLHYSKYKRCLFIFGVLQWFTTCKITAGFPVGLHQFLSTTSLELFGFGHFKE
ncbi:hypothetical protein CEXT_699071 [Caerostris extrusa]|uniref:Uncharacterized protein n=1 Tax=Caerostris extrusa TaxID=172846 RepID=A0AAV4VY53_CAEEX|nr:hypothetical protein CEXT_699071 [Caerostris extrusa]